MDTLQFATKRIASALKPLPKITAIQRCRSRLSTRQQPTRHRRHDFHFCAGFFHRSVLPQLNRLQRDDPSSGCLGNPMICSRRLPSLFTAVLRNSVSPRSAQHNSLISLTLKSALRKRSPRREQRRTSISRAVTTRDRMGSKILCFSRS